MDNDPLSFITDDDIKVNIVDSIQYIYILFDQANKVGVKELNKQETYRVITLYVVSIIEAILLFIYKNSTEKLTYIEYKHPVSISSEYKHITYAGKGKVVVAVQEINTRSDHQIRMTDLVEFFKTNKLIKSDLAEEILEVNDVRNTFHLAKPRHTIKLDIKKAEAAFSLLYRIITEPPKVA